MRINIISGDGVISRMLVLELNRRGFDTVSGASGGALAVVDIDTADIVRDIPCISFSYEKQADLRRPFSVSELCDLIKSKLPESGEIKKSNYDHPIFDPDENSVEINNNTIHLSKQEYLLLELLYKNLGNTVLKDDIKKHVWGSLGNDNRLRVYVKYIREKIEPIYQKRVFHSVHGRGYTMKLD